MAEVIHRLDIATGADDAHYSGAQSLQTGRVYLIVGSHLSSNSRPWAGFRFQVPTGIDPDKVTDARLEVTSYDTSAFRVVIRVEQGPAGPWSGGTGRPDNRWNAVGSAHDVVWDEETVADERYTSPDISSAVRAALENLSPGDYIGVILGPDIGHNVNRFQWLHSYESSPSFAASLVITTNDEERDASVTTTAPGAAAAVGEPSSYVTFRDLSYHDGIGDPTNRLMDVFVPAGDPPPGGWPVVVFVPGGGWNSGNHKSLPPALRDDILASGAAVVSVNYKKTEFNLLFNTNTGWTRPEWVRDVLTALKTIGDDTTGVFNPDRIYGVGYSAGAHLILEAALLAEDQDRDSYDLVWRGVNTAKGDRYAAFPTNNVSQGRTGFPHLRGVFIFAGPVRMTRFFQNQNLLYGAVAVAWGFRPQDSGVAAAIGGEGDLDDYMRGAEGTIYAARAASAPSFRIGYVGATDDGIVAPNCGIDALVPALDDVGYDVSSGNGEVAEGVGLSRFIYTAGYLEAHDRVLTADYPLSRGFFREWLASALEDDGPGSQDAHYQHFAAFNGFFPRAGSPTVTTEDFTVVDAHVTPSAVSAAASAGSPVPSVAQHREVTAPAQSASVALAAPSTGSAQDRSVSVTALDLSVEASEPVTEVRQDRSITTDAPGASWSASVASTEPIQDRTAYPTAPGVASILSDSTPSRSEPGLVSTVAPRGIIEPAEVEVGIRQDREVFPDPGRWSTAASTAGVSVSKEVAVEAFEVGADLPGVGVSTSSPGEVSPNAPRADAATGTVDVTASSPGTADTVAPRVTIVLGDARVSASSPGSASPAAPEPVRATVGVPVVTASTPGTVAVSALVVDASPASPEVTGTISATVAVEAPGANLGVPTPTVSNGLVYVVASRLLPARWTARVLRPR